MSYYKSRDHTQKGNQLDKPDLPYPCKLQHPGWSN